MDFNNSEVVIRWKNVSTSGWSAGIKKEWRVLSVQHHKELLHIIIFNEKESTVNALYSEFLPPFFSFVWEYSVGLTEGFVWSSRSLSAA